MSHSSKDLVLLSGNSSVVYGDIVYCTNAPHLKLHTYLHISQKDTTTWYLFIKSSIETNPNVHRTPFSETWPKSYGVKPPDSNKHREIFVKVFLRTVNQVPVCNIPFWIIPDWLNFFRYWTASGRIICSNLNECVFKYIARQKGKLVTSRIIRHCINMHHRFHYQS